MEQDENQREKIHKVKSIIEKEINKELQNKQNELSEINERIEKTLRHLEILKYVATVNYYEHNNTILSSRKNNLQDEETKDEKAQTRIHPSVKKLMPFRSNYDKSFTDVRPYETRHKKNVSEPGPSTENVVANGDASEIQKIPKYVPPIPKELSPDKRINSQRSGLSKIAQKIIIGNVSKWISPDTREDSSTHKWMMYIRSQDKENDVIKLIRKVRYFLHESYKPHDIIDVTSSPFTLTRRGWGEFPVRVQLHFTHPLNKPVDIVHNLKLDMTCSGMQMLGSETIVEVSLHSEEVPSPKKHNSDYANGHKTTEIPNVFDSQPFDNHSKEKDFLIEIIRKEHDYHEPDSAKNNSNSFSKMISVKNHRHNGLSIADIVSSAKMSDKLIFSRNEKEIFKTLKSLANKLESDSQSKYCIKTFRHNYMVNVIQRIHSSKINTVEGLVKWFFQRWPIVTELSLDPTYKCIHPYSCPSEEEFFKYNIGKQRSAEWYRAKAVQKILFSLKDVIPIEEDIWSTKQILLWSRFHGFSPLSFHRRLTELEPGEVACKRLKPEDESSSDSDDDSRSVSSKKSKSNDSPFLNGLNIFEKRRRGRRRDPSEDSLDRRRRKNYRNLNTYTNDSINGIDAYGATETRVLETVKAVPEVDIVLVDVNIKSESPSPSKRKEPLITISTGTSSEQLLQKFVSDTSRQIGVKLTEEEIVPGVMADSVTRVMSQTVVSFVEDLLRKSLAQGWLRNDDRAPECLEVDDVLAAITENPVFDIFTNRGLGALPCEQSNT